MLNSTFVDDPDNNGSQDEIICHTLDQQEDDSEFICDWIDVQEHSKRLEMNLLD
jgi:hypothetical protein